MRDKSAEAELSMRYGPPMGWSAWGGTDSSLLPLGWFSRLVFGRELQSTQIGIRRMTVEFGWLHDPGTRASEPIADSMTIRVDRRAY
jgi:hypothetical protein